MNSKINIQNIDKMDSRCFLDSVIALGEENLRRKYTFKFRNCKLSESRRGDIDEGIYNAINGSCVG